MFNIIIFLIGAGIMFYMAWRSWSRRRRLMTRGEKVEAAVAGTVQSRDGEAYLLEFSTAGGIHHLHYPKPAKGRELAQGPPVSMELAERFAQAVTQDINPRDSWRAARDFRLHIAVESAKRAFVESVRLAGGVL